MTNPSNFSPDWASPPGETISEILEQRRISLQDFAGLLNRSTTSAEKLIKGLVRIEPETATELSKLLGASTDFWLTRDRRYWEAIARAERAWVDGLPVDDMVKFGWIQSNDADTATQLYKFFDVLNVSAWRVRYRDLHQAVAFRMSPAFESHPAAVAAWLRQGEIEAGVLGCDQWNRERFLSALGEVRSMTRLRHPEHFLPKLQALCCRAGVAVVVVRAPDGCRASGAARFLSSSLGVIQLSFRYLTDDHFWFTVFHEAGHLVLHGDKGLHLEGVEARSPKDEEEANQFAVEGLIPRELWPELRGLRSSTFEILRFASKAGVAPGIVVGQLQHLGIVPQNHLNRLKRRFQWGDTVRAQPRKGS